MVAIGAFPSRNAGHLVSTDDVSPFDEQLRRLLVEKAHDFDLLAKGVGVIGVSIEPVSTPMRLKFSFLLKTIVVKLTELHASVALEPVNKCSDVGESANVYDVSPTVARF